jgi:hypothetical protein
MSSVLASTHISTLASTKGASPLERYGHSRDQLMQAAGLTKWQRVHNKLSRKQGARAESVGFFRNFDKLVVCRLYIVPVNYGENDRASVSDMPNQNERVRPKMIPGDLLSNVSHVLRRIADKSFQRDGDLVLLYELVCLYRGRTEITVDDAPLVAPHLVKRTQGQVLSLARPAK